MQNYDLKWVVIPLHSSVTAEDQAKVFDTAGNTFRKIILSTNIAESSVTVPDIAYGMLFSKYNITKYNDSSESCKSCKTLFFINN